MRRVLLASAAAVLCGCVGGGATARFEQRKYVGLTSATFGDYVIPVFSISEGPSATVWQSKACGSVVEFSGEATTTNRTSALGCYENDEQKTFSFHGRFSVSPTNGVECASVTNAVPPMD